MPPFVFNKHRLLHGTDAGNRKVVEAENGGSPHLETPERFHILESPLVHVGHNIEVEAHGVFPLFVEGKTVDAFGKVHIGYVPNGSMVGLSKIARLVEVFARRLQVQERLTKEICDSLFKTLSTHGVIVMIEGQHLCMQMRGVEKQGAVTTTLEYTGCFNEDSKRAEFLRLLGK